MAELPPTYEKDYLDLLYDYHSDETKKTRRNLIVTSFLVIAVRFIGIPLSDIKLFGVDLTHGDIRAISLIFILLLAYWFVMFIVYSLYDHRLQSERRELLSKHVRSLYGELDMNKKILEDKNTGPYKRQAAVDRNAVLEHQIGIYMLQQERTKGVNGLGALIMFVEVFLPIGLVAAAIKYLVQYL